MSSSDPCQITSIEQLRALHAEPKSYVLKAKSSELTAEMITLIGQVRLVCIASEGDEGMDLSPRGGKPGFIKVIDNKTLAFADRPGNNKLETLSNLVAGSGRVAMMFLLPGLDYFIRLNGDAVVTADPQLLEAVTSDPECKLVVKILINEVYPHCPKASQFSELWSSSSHLDLSTSPSMGEVVKGIA